MRRIQHSERCVQRIMNQYLNLISQIISLKDNILYISFICVDVEAKLPITHSENSWVPLKELPLGTVERSKGMGGKKGPQEDQNHETDLSTLL